MKLFGFEIKKVKEKQTDIPKLPNITRSSLIFGSKYSQGSNLHSSLFDSHYLIDQYRGMANCDPVSVAIDHIVNDAVVYNADNNYAASIDFSKEFKDINLQNKILNEYDYILKILKFKERGSEYFRTWYVDGQINFILFSNPDDLKDGIIDIQYVDPRFLKKIVEFNRGPSLLFDTNDISKNINEYYVYDYQNAVSNNFSEISNLSLYSFNQLTSSSLYSGFLLTPDSIAHSDSGISNSNNSLIYSHLHKAIKPFNHLETVEEFTILYTINRGIDRKLFKIYVGDLPSDQQQAYLENVVDEIRSNIEYDSSTGKLKSSSNLHSVMRDYFMTVDASGNSSVIEDINGASNISSMSDNLIYFEKKLYKSLNVPISRLDSTKTASIGRVTEIERDEINFSNFVTSLRNRFFSVVVDMLKKQCILKGLCSAYGWNEIESNLVLKFEKNNYYAEIKEAEMLKSRIETASVLEPYINKYVSNNYIRQHILKQTEQDIQKMDSEIEEENNQYELKAKLKADIDLQSAENVLKDRELDIESDNDQVEVTELNSATSIPSLAKPLTIQKRKNVRK